MNERNLVELFRRQAERLGPRPALRYKRDGMWHDLTWEQYRAESLAAAAALVESGVERGDRVGMIAENSVDWLIADMAILSVGAINVPPHAPLTARQIHFQLSDADINFLFVSNRAQLDKVRQIRAQLPPLRGMVVFDSTDMSRGEGRGARGEKEELSSLAPRPSPLAPPEMLSWDAFRQRGRRALSRVAEDLARREAALGPDDLATIMYTSGTTGNPKGVMLTHGNLVSNVRSMLARSGQQPSDVVLSWLPFTHIYARTVDHYSTLVSGVLLCIAECADTLVQDLADVQPTHMASVPRFYEKVLTLVADPDPQVVGQRLRDVLGPRVDWLSSGGAPLPYPVARAFVDAGVLVLQGYGLTETSPVISFNSKEDYKLETVGRPLPGVEVKIAADGEVLTRGPHVMKGYWKNPQATGEAIREGWFHTGDLGEIDADGFLKITGRKKELLVLSNGKKVVPAFIEGLLQSDPCIDQAVVCGEGRNYLTALIVPHWGNVRAALVEAGREPSLEAASPAVLELLQHRIRKALSDVSSAEQVRKFVLVPKPFSVAAEELTVSLKLRRNIVLAKYARQIEELYRRDG